MTIAGAHIADPVIKAIARLEFEDGLRTVVLHGSYWYPCAPSPVSIQIPFGGGG